MTAPVIRRAVASDAGAMRGIAEAAYSKYIERIGKPPGPMLLDYEAVALGTLSFVMVRGGTVIGLVVLVEDRDGILLDNVALHPDYAGRGHGRRLLEFAEATAREAGYGALDLYTHELMHENVALYRRAGYEETERRSESGYARVYMWKGLG